MDDISYVTLVLFMISLIRLAILARVLSSQGVRRRVLLCDVRRYDELVIQEINDGNSQVALTPGRSKAVSESESEQFIHSSHALVPFRIY